MQINFVLVFIINQNSVRFCIFNRNKSIMKHEIVHPVKSFQSLSNPLDTIKDLSEQVMGAIKKMGFDLDLLSAVITIGGSHGNFKGKIQPLSKEKVESMIHNNSCALQDLGSVVAHEISQKAEADLFLISTTDFTADFTAVRGTGETTADENAEQLLAFIRDNFFEYYDQYLHESLTTTKSSFDGFTGEL